MPIVNIPKGTPDWDIPINENFQTLENEKVGLDSNGKIDKSLIPDDIGGLENFQEKHTYAELAALIAEKKLVPGMQYVLMDYQTKYIQPISNVLKTSTVEKLVLTAIDESHFAPECSSLSYPQDIVTYDFNMNKCEDNSTARNGFIKRRKSTNLSGNYALLDAPCDWRTIIVPRFKPDPNYYLKNNTRTSFKVWTSGTVELGELYKVGDSIYMSHDEGIPQSNNDTSVFYKVYDDINISVLTTDLIVSRTPNNETCKLIKTSEYTEYPIFTPKCNHISCGGTLSFFNNVFIDTEYETLGENSNHNFFKKSSNRCELATNCNYNILINSSNLKLDSNCSTNYLILSHFNTLGQGSSGNVFVEACENYLSNNCSNNVFSRNSSRNFFESRCERNVLYLNCYDNSFSCLSSDNILVYGYINSFGAGCRRNKLTRSTMNQLNNNCRDNILPADCNRNTLGSNCSNNVFSTACSNNIIGAFSCNNQLGYNNIACNISPFCNNNTLGNYHSYLHIKFLTGKNLSNISALSTGSPAYPKTIESDNTGKFLYWYINSSGQIVRTLIP